jgi:hypothetical protein
MVRISQCDSKDQVSVAEYYSSSLVVYVRQVDRRLCVCLRVAAGTAQRAPLPNTTCGA